MGQHSPATARSPASGTGRQPTSVVQAARSAVLDPVAEVSRYVDAGGARPTGITLLGRYPCKAAQSIWKRRHFFKTANNLEITQISGGEFTHGRQPGPGDRVDVGCGEWARLELSPKALGLRQQLGRGGRHTLAAGASTVLGLVTWGWTGHHRHTGSQRAAGVGPERGEAGLQRGSCPASGQVSAVGRAGRTWARPGPFGRTAVGQAPWEAAGR